MKKNKKLLTSIKNLGLLSSREIMEKLSITQPTLSRMVRAGELLKLSHSVYCHHSTSIKSQDLDFAIACKKFGPDSAIGGLSALFHFGLIEQAPLQVWIIVPPSKANTNKLYRCIRTKISAKIGVEVKNHYKIVTIERAILEALKLGDKVGIRIAVNAARSALQNGKTTEKKLGLMAKSLKLRSVLEKYWELIVV